MYLAGMNERGHHQMALRALSMLSSHTLSPLNRPYDVVRTTRKWDTSLLLNLYDKY